MRRPLERFRSVPALAAAVGALSLAVPAGGTVAQRSSPTAGVPKLPAQPLRLGFYMESREAEALFFDNASSFRRARRAGGEVTRLLLPWSWVAAAEPPTRAAARSPAYKGYKWGKFDSQVRRAAANRLQVMITILHPPAWAHDGWPRRPHGPWDVDRSALADFATATARRYSGKFAGLPRVRYWMVWNEPNLASYLNPQFGPNGELIAGPIYRGLVNAFADAVHGVSASNIVVAGGTAPFTAWTRNSNEKWGAGPLPFMRTMLCLSKRLRPTCSARSKFDVWAHHPYTTGGPRHHAFSADDVSLGDLPEMRAVLDAAIRHRRIASRSRPEFWVTEFCWDSNPPDPHGVPANLHARWVSEALYQMWRSGVSLVTWFTVEDQQRPSPLQCGLYFASGRPKPALQAYRFPFVAYPRGRVALTWGRTPWGRPARVRVEQRSGSGWRSLGVTSTNRYGIFRATFRTSDRRELRARLLGPRGQVSRSFSLTRPKEVYRNPFGEEPRP